LPSPGDPTCTGGGGITRAGHGPVPSRKRRGGGASTSTSEMNFPEPPEHEVRRTHLLDCWVQQEIRKAGSPRTIAERLAPPLYLLGSILIVSWQLGSR
jgi:hypothetical protein